MNEGKVAEKSESARALARMQTLTAQGKPIESYTAHGIELVHTQLDKLRIRQVDDANADVEEETEPEQQAELGGGFSEDVDARDNTVEDEGDEQE